MKWGATAIPYAYGEAWGPVLKLQILWKAAEGLLMLAGLREPEEV